MLLPNILIVGTQKSGTTWLYRCLRKSPHVFAPKVKEQNFFNRQDITSKLGDYAALYEGSTEPLRLESTPHYFRLPDPKLDIATNIKSAIPDVKCIVSFRDPVERYLSSYTHHMMQGRFPYEEVIDTVSDEYRMLSLGMYADILNHWRTVFPDIHTIIYDKIQNDKPQVIANIARYLGQDLEIPEEDMEFLTNSKYIKARKAARNYGDEGARWTVFPKLSPRLRGDLRRRYRGQIEELSILLDLDLSHWLGRGQEHGSPA